MPVFDRFLALAIEAHEKVRDAEREHKSGDPESRDSRELLKAVRRDLAELLKLAQTLEAEERPYGGDFRALVSLVEGNIKEAQGYLGKRRWEDAYGPLAGARELLDNLLRVAPDAALLNSLHGFVTAAHQLVVAEGEDGLVQAASLVKQAGGIAQEAELKLNLTGLFEALQAIDDEDLEDAQWRLEDLASEFSDDLTALLEDLANLDYAAL
jgi:hypothetical protein